MKKSAVFLSIFAVIALCATAYLGLSMKFNGRTDGLANAHFHAATTTLLVSLIAHGLSIVALLKSPNPQPASE